jgi:hypothetical protein
MEEQRYNKEKKERRVGEIISPSGRYFDELKNTF